MKNKHDTNTYIKVTSKLSGLYYVDGASWDIKHKTFSVHYVCFAQSHTAYVKYNGLNFGNA